MIDFTWKVFSQTGNVETYLLLKELEEEPKVEARNTSEKSEASALDTKM
ncbi:MAG TPA: YqzL family protein [Bacillota bacterium]|nr:YqzL family protein [Bacillota bacterium]